MNFRCPVSQSSLHSSDNQSFPLPLWLSERLAIEIAGADQKMVCDYLQRALDTVLRGLSRDLANER